MIASQGDHTPRVDDARYRLLVEAVTDYAIYMLDPGGVIASWNPGAAQIKGYDAHEVIGSHFSRFYTEEDRAADLPKNALATAAREGRFEAEGWRVRSNGSRFWALVVIDAIRASNGDLIGFAKVTRDLSERRAADDALRRSEERFRLLVQSVTDYAIFMLDPHGRVSNWNTGAERIKGYAPEEIVGSHFSRFYTEEDRASGLPERGLETAAQTGAFQTEGWRVRKDGTRFWASVVIDAIRGNGGALIGFAKITRDMSERREAALAQERVRESLVQGQKLEAIGQLTGGVAHDFNNLLTPIIGNLELLRMRHEDERSQRQISGALEAAERARVLVSRLLTFARRQLLEARAVDVAGLVDSLTDLIGRSIGPGITVVVDAPAALATLVDPNQLEMAILNLAVNARDAMPTGGTLTIAVRQDTIGPDHPTGLPPSAYVRLSVIDTGIGMDEETCRRCTDPFFTTKGVGAGTGLGLAMVQALATQSGGKLLLSSTRGIGTRAEIWLPITHETPAIIAPVVTEAVRATRDATILLVDDEELVRSGVAEMLRELDYTVAEANCGAQALELIRGGLTPDLLITDYLMPGMTGLDLIPAVRRLRAGLPALLITGYSSRANKGDPALDGAPKLAKPFRQAELGRRVAELLDVPKVVAFNKRASSGSSD